MHKNSSSISAPLSPDDFYPPLNEAEYESYLKDFHKGQDRNSADPYQMSPKELREKGIRPEGEQPKEKNPRRPMAYGGEGIAPSQKDSALIEGLTGLDETMMRIMGTAKEYAQLVQSQGLAGLQHMPPAMAAWLSTRLQPVEGDPFATQAASTQVIDNVVSPADKMPTGVRKVPMPQEFIDNENWDEYEDFVDKYIKENNLQPGDTFTVYGHTNGSRTYEYLDPAYGGRKNWIEIKPSKKDLMSRAPSQKDSALIGEES